MRIASLLAFLALYPAANGETATSLARVFSSHMVLQRDEPVAIFGRDQPGRRITVAFGGQTRSVTTSPTGDWKLELDPLKTSAIGQKLTVSGSTKVTLDDILVGEVWLAAGQSNMNFQVKDCSTRPAPENLPLIRMANWEGTVGTAAGQVYGPVDFEKLTPSRHYRGTWQTIDADTVLPQSGVACFFADALARDLKVPVGIVDISLGGTSTEAFISPDALRKSACLAAAFEDPRHARTLGQWTTARISENLTGYIHNTPEIPFPHPFAPGFLYSAAMPHLIPFTFKGVIWYQGESNAEFTTGPFRWNEERLADYQAMVMKTLVDSWRTGFHKPAMPFLMVELPRIQAPNRERWPAYREAQQRVAREIDGVEIATITNSGDGGNNVHPADKEPVGERLALLARAKVYGESLESSGPTFAGRSIAGDAIFLRFTHPGKGLKDRDGGKLRNFEIAGSDRRFVPAEASISGDGIKVRSASVARPVAVRHAWSMNIDVDLSNSEGLTAPPFRTDSWLVAPGRRIRVACIGDSITSGAGLADPARESYPAQLAILLGGGFDVRGFGKSGSGIHRPAMKYDRTREFRDALAFQPDIVICNLGINDLTQWGAFTRDDLVAEYRNLIDAFASLPSAPYIIQWNPLAPLFPGQEYHGKPIVAALNGWLGDAIALTGVDRLDMSTPLKEHPEWFPDPIHPNDTGSKAIAEIVSKRLQALDQTFPAGTGNPSSENAIQSESSFDKR